MHDGRLHDFIRALPPDHPPDQRVHRLVGSTPSWACGTGRPPPTARSRTGQAAPISKVPIDDDESFVASRPYVTSLKIAVIRLISDLDRGLVLAFVREPRLLPLGEVIALVPATGFTRHAADRGCRPAAGGAGGTERSCGIPPWAFLSKGKTC
jgi:hypothetical protein